MAVNGNTPASASDEAQAALAEEAARIRVLLEDEHARERQLTLDLRASVDRRKMLEKVIDMLEGREKPKSQPKHRKPVGKDWGLSDGKLEEVWQLLRSQTEPFTANGISGNGTSGESVRRAVVILRERGLLRLMGKARGGGKLLLPMPGTENMNSRGEVIDGA